VTRRKHLIAVGITALAVIGVSEYTAFFATEYRSKTADAPERFIPLPQLDRADYDARLLALAHVGTTTATSSPQTTATSTATSTSRLWPVRAVYPNAEAILPFKRVVAYYGNFYSRQMGVLGEYPEEQLLAMLASTTSRWERADPATPVLPAIQYIAVVAHMVKHALQRKLLRVFLTFHRHLEWFAHARGVAREMRQISSGAYVLKFSVERRFHSPSGYCRKISSEN
jgi:hypothetical protein